MKKINTINKLMLLICSALCFASCSNLIEDLKAPEAPIDPVVPEEETEETPTYHIMWSTPIAAADNKSLWELAANGCKTVVFGKTADYASVTDAANGTYTVFDAGETSDDLIKAYYKAVTVTPTYDNADSWDGELYVLSDGIIAFEDDDLISVDDQTNKSILQGTFTNKPAGFFFCCMGLNKLATENIDTSLVTDMNCLFLYCWKLSDSECIKNLDTSSVTNMSMMFALSGFENIDLRGFDTSKVTDMTAMFSNMIGTKTVNISGLDVHNVKTMEGMFSGGEVDSSLKSIDFGSSFDTSKVYIMTSMFEDCDKLETLDLSGFDFSYAENMDEFLKDCKLLTSVKFPENCNTQYLSTMDHMFYNCENLVSVNLTGFDTSGVFGMEQMFANCTSLVTLDLSSFDFKESMRIDNMFNGASSLTTIYVKAGTDLGAKSNISGTDMFTDCDSLVGGNGTEYDSEHTDDTYARIDGVDSNPGYFTLTTGVTPLTGSIEVKSSENDTVLTATCEAFNATDLQYQWYNSSDLTTWTEINGASSTKLTSVESGYSYKIVVTSPTHSGSVESLPIALGIED